MRRLFLLLFLCTSAAAAQAQHFTLLAYNTENTFDTLPPGTAPSAGIYYRKLSHIAQVVLAADTLHPADVALLSEVESDTAVSHLLSRTPLASVGYDYVITHSADARGINIALVYQPRTFHLLNWRSIRPDASQAQGATTRDVLCASGTVAGGDTLDIYAVHLPSRLGAARAQHLRRQLLRQLADDIDSVAAHRRNAAIVVAGDFNAEPTSADLRMLVSRWHDEKNVKRKGKTVHQGSPSGTPRLVNLMAGLPGGSYKYRGRWQWIDQVLVSLALLEPSRRPTVDVATPFAIRSPFLLQADETYGGQKPYRSFLGATYIGGYSDHLPVVLRLELGQ